MMQSVGGCTALNVHTKRHVFPSPKKMKKLANSQMFHNNHGCEKMRLFGEREGLEYSLGQIHKALITPDKWQINTVSTKGFTLMMCCCKKPTNLATEPGGANCSGVPSAQCYLFDPLVAMLSSVCLDRSHGKKLKEETETKKKKAWWPHSRGSDA